MGPLKVDSHLVTRPLLAKALRFSAMHPLHSNHQRASALETQRPASQEQALVRTQLRASHQSVDLDSAVARAALVRPAVYLEALVKHLNRQLEGLDLERTQRRVNRRQAVSALGQALQQASRPLEALVLEQAQRQANRQRVTLVSATPRQERAVCLVLQINHQQRVVYLAAPTSRRQQAVSEAVSLEALHLVYSNRNKHRLKELSKYINCYTKQT